MAQLGEDSFAAGDGLMSVDEAVAALFARVSAVADTEAVSLAEAEEPHSGGGSHRAA